MQQDVLAASFAWCAVLLFTATQRHISTGEARNLKAIGSLLSLTMLASSSGHAQTGCGDLTQTFYMLMCSTQVSGRHGQYAYIHFSPGNAATYSKTKAKCCGKEVSTVTYTSGGNGCNPALSRSIQAQQFIDPLHKTHDYAFSLAWATTSWCVSADSSEAGVLHSFSLKDKAV